jgi:hypothetical protein
MKSKRGQTWTIFKLIKWVLLLALLGIVVGGVISGGLNPLFEKVGGQFDKVMLVLGVNGNLPDAGCRPSDRIDSNSMASVGVSAKLEVCRDSCTYELVSPTTLFGFTELTIDRGGTKIGNEEKKYEFSDIVSGYNVGVDMESYSSDREIYQDMQNIFSEFARDNPEHDMDDFSFSTNARFSIMVVREKTWLLGRNPDDIIYYWDGEIWVREINGRVEAFGEYRNQREQATREIVNEIYEYFRDGDDVYWGYEGEGISNVPGSDFSIDYENVDINFIELEEWFNNKTNFIDENDVLYETDTIGGEEVIVSQQDGYFRIVIEDTGFLNTDTVYYYKYNSNPNLRRIMKDNLIRDTRQENAEVLSNILEWSQDGHKIWWHFGENYDSTYTIVEDEKIITLEDFEEDLIEWVGEMSENYAETRERNEGLMEEFIPYVESREADGYPTHIKIIEDIGPAKNFVYIDYESYKTGYNDEIDVDVKKGVYVEDGDLVFVSLETYSDNGMTLVADKNGWVYLDDSWDDFEKAHATFNVLYEKCGRENEEDR